MSNMAIIIRYVDVTSTLVEEHIVCSLHTVFITEMQEVYSV